MSERNSLACYSLGIGFGFEVQGLGSRVRLGDANPSSNNDLVNQTEVQRDAGIMVAIEGIPPLIL